MCNYVFFCYHVCGEIKLLCNTLIISTSNHNTPNMSHTTTTISRNASMLYFKGYVPVRIYNFISPSKTVAKKETKKGKMYTIH